MTHPMLDDLKVEALHRLYRWMNDTRMRTEVAGIPMNTALAMTIMVLMHLATHLYLHNSNADPGGEAAFFKEAKRLYDANREAVQQYRQESA